MATILPLRKAGDRSHAPCSPTDDNHLYSEGGRLQANSCIRCVLLPAIIFKTGLHPRLLVVGSTRVEYSDFVSDSAVAGDAG